MDTIKKTSYYYVIVNTKNGKMLLQDCKAPIYWNKKVADKRCELFKGFEVVEMPAKDFNDLLSIIMQMVLKEEIVLAERNE